MKDFKIYLSVVSILLLVYLIAQYNKPAPVNWRPTLDNNDKVPFGTYILYQQLNDVFPGAKVIKIKTSVYQHLTDSNTTPGNYVIIAKTVLVAKDDFIELIKYIKNGNSVFISCFNFSGFIADTLKIASTYGYNKENSKLNFTNSRLAQPGGYSFGHDISNQYFSSFDTTKAVVIAENDHGQSTYLRYKFGKGNLYLCLNPCTFSNYSLLTNQGAEYAAKVFSYMPAVTRVYWDEYQNSDILTDDSPLRVFFRYPTLKWAYYISLFGVIIFILFEMKRRQRIIPVIEPLRNSTLDFVNVVGQVYYEKRDNINIAHKKILYLFTYLRDNYQLKTSKLDDEFIEKLTAKVDIDLSLANDLINYIQFISVQARINDNELIKLNTLIEQFYSLTS